MVTLHLLRKEVCSGGFGLMIFLVNSTTGRWSQLQTCYIKYVLPISGWHWTNMCLDTQTLFFITEIADCSTVVMSTLRSRSSRCVRRFSSRSHLTHHVAPHQGSLPGTLPTGWGQQLWLHCFANGINPLSTGPRSHPGAIAAIAPRLGGWKR